MQPLLARFSGKRLLIVEWETMLTKEVRKCLEELGTEIIGPIGSLEAEHAISAQKPDAAIVDLNMPGVTAVWLDDLLIQNDVPYVFAQGSGTPPHHRDAGFHLVNDPDQLAAIAAVLFPMTALH